MTMHRLLFAATILLTSVSAVAVDPPPDVQFSPDVVYGTGGGEELKLNLSRPKDAAKKKLPCVVFIHGGGWAHGDRSVHNDGTWKIAQFGYVSATVGYRLTPKHRFPAQIHDVKAAIRFLRAKSDEYGLDPDRIAVVGFSAGAHLAMLLGVTQKEDGLEGDGGKPEQSSKVQAVVAFFGPTDLTADDLPEHVKPIMASLIGGTLSEKPDDYRKASPITYVSAGDAPMLLFQGTKDPLVPHTQAYRMLDAMTKAGVAGRGELLVGAGHGWFVESPEFKRTIEATLAFLQQHLKVVAPTSTPTPAAAAAPQ
jgi:acetyl esterase/lipase